MSDVLLISVRLHEGWYHGSGGTPSPARMFQALVAGAGISGPLDNETVESLRWLACQAPPIVGSPHAISQKAYVNFVPNNDLDAKQGDDRRIGEIRTKKVIAPLVFDSTIPFLFAWTLADEAAVEAAKAFMPLADRVYQLGRAVDMAWAWAELLSADKLLDRLNDYPGIVRRPSDRSGDVDCPMPLSLESLHRRYMAAAEQFDRSADGKGQTFRQRPKPIWEKVNYAGVASQFVLDILRSDDAGFAPWPLERSSALVVSVRDGAVKKLQGVLKNRIPEISQVLIGRTRAGENDGPTSSRVRIIPLPSIGHRHADLQIRRILIHVPCECPVRADDIQWALSGLQLVHPTLCESVDVTVSSDGSQLRFFGVDTPARVWRSVTPVVLTDSSRRRLDPVRGNADDIEKKNARERYGEQDLASAAMAQALRHAAVGAKVNSFRFQREPFDLRGTRAEPFSDGTRFNKHSLWHVELVFDSPIAGPLLVGDGRFLGLGLMRPVTPTVGVFAFSIESGLIPNPDPIGLAQALRRTVMSRTRDVLGTSRIPPYFSGHREDGTPACREVESHLAFVFDPIDRQLLVVTPEHLDGRNHGCDTENLATLESALQDLYELRAGAAGILQLRPAFIEDTSHRLFQASHVWVSVTPYQVNRHARKSTAEVVLKNDVIRECERRRLPHPQVNVLAWAAKPGVGLNARLQLTFRHAVHGPIILGRTRHIGGGVFEAMDARLSRAD